MCGIIGTVSLPGGEKVLVEGLKRLEYRGYDSAGIAVLAGKVIDRVRAVGKIAKLEEALDRHPLSGQTGIGHTRWATHGSPTESNAHPHSTPRVALVHNGIIENHQPLRQELIAKGVKFTSETDTEVVLHLIDQYLLEGRKPEEAVRLTLERIEGAFALAIIFAGREDLLIAARKGSPLAVGFAKQGMLIGSDAIALAPFCRKLAYLEEGDMAILHAKDVSIFNAEGQPVKRAVKDIQSSGALVDKGDYAHFMLKEIHEQPQVLAATLNAFYDAGQQSFRLPELPFPATELDRITMVACGTSYYAALTARNWFEQLARISTGLDIASEFRYRKPIMHPKGLSIFISQSGETADTLAALRYCKSVGQPTAALVNVEESSMAMEADDALFTQAGREIGVASTKAFTTQLAALAAMALGLAHARRTIDREQYEETAHAFGQLPDLAEQCLRLDGELKQLAKRFLKTEHMFYIGRGGAHAIACEGALKMKEISYIHAEAYAAGELKHGPLALIDDKVPVVVVAPDDDLFDKTASNLQETLARGAEIILVSSARGVEELKNLATASIVVPDCHPLIAPILYAIPLQLLAYHTAVLRGTDVDQPRNLAKSVTVE